jgi:capsid portal protein
MLISGGVLAQDAKEALELGLANRGAQKQRGMVVEIHSTSGSLSDSGDVHVQIDKMGNDKQKDSLFENYDDKCERRVRGAFRLPAIFVGKADSYNFATAFASYMVGEAQIFAPERKAFDDIMTLKLLPEILQKKDTKAIFRSLPIVINDSKERLLALTVVAAKGGMTYGEFYKTLNEITGLKMQIPPSLVNQIIPAQQSGGPTGGIDNVSNMLDASTASPTEAQG